MKSPQLTDTVLMIEPTLFGPNEETMSDNVFMKRESSKSETEIREKAMKEFEAMVGQLKKEGIRVVVCPSKKESYTPDAVFPNNWISFHPSRIVLYPMKALSRRAERQMEEVKEALKGAGLVIHQPILDLTALEKRQVFLEGTGSLVFDRTHHVAFACLSQRTTNEGLKTFAKEMGYELIIFRALDRKKNEVYHTNVVMSIGEQFAVICLEAIADPTEQKEIEGKLKKLNKEIIPISLKQLYRFCGNILQVSSSEGPKIILSKTALNNFTLAQRKILEKHGKLVVVSIPQIETTGGGSARCMMAEVFALQQPSNDAKK